MVNILAVNDFVQRLLYENIVATDEQRMRMTRSSENLDKSILAGHDVYGITRGFGPHVKFHADKDSKNQGINLIHSLAVGQGTPLEPEVTKLLLSLRLNGMLCGYSAVSFNQWQKLTDIHNAGFIPVVPSLGSVSASGDLIPLAHAALAYSGHGESWISNSGQWVRMEARKVLADLNLEPIQWDARDALAFVNGSSASLAIALENHICLEQACYIASILTGRIVELLEASAEPYAEAVVLARGASRGQKLISRWISSQLSFERNWCTARQLQEAYSIRCAPQILGSVWDHLQSLGDLLLQEAHACSDNPVVTSDAIFHAGNFHAINAGLVSDHHAILIHQVAFLAERQLALLVEPTTNGGLPTLLASIPGETSGLAGAQLAASAMVAEIRQKSGPSTTTALPTNLFNQDIVPMSLVAGRRTSEQCNLLRLILGTLGIATSQVNHIVRPGDFSDNRIWDSLSILSPRLENDRSLSEEIRLSSDQLFIYAKRSMNGKDIDQFRNCDTGNSND